MRRKDSAPANTINNVTISTRKRWRRANWTMRWIIVISTGPRLALVLQGILKLQKEAAVSDYALAFLKSARNLRSATLAGSELNQPAREFVLFCGGLDINKGLVFGVTQDGSVWNRKGIRNGAGIHRCRDVHILLQLPAGILRHDTRLQRSRIRIKRGGEIRNPSVKYFGVRIRTNVHAIPEMHVGHLALVHVDQHPHRAHVGDGEDLRGAGLKQLTGTDEPLDNLSRYGCEDGNLRGRCRRIFHDRFRIVDSQNAKSVFARLEIGLGLITGRFRRLKIGFGNCAVSKEVLSTSVRL